MNRRQKGKRKISSRFFYLLLVVSALLFFYALTEISVFSLKWIILIGGILIMILLITGIFTLKLRSINLFQKVVNLLLSVILILGSIVLPRMQDSVADLFGSASNVRINVYALTNEYKAQHPETFDDSNTVYLDSKLSKQDFRKYGQSLIYGTVTSADSENQKYTVEELAEKSGGNIHTLDYDSLSSAVDALYQNQVDLLIMSESYASVIVDMPDYSGFSTDTQIVCTLGRSSDFKTTEPLKLFSGKHSYLIFVGGNDQTGEPSIQGRTDVNMVVAVNTKKKQVALISLPRDSYIPNPYYDGSYDKLTHLGLVGIDNTMQGIGNMLDQKIDSYVLVNFDTFRDIISALGGVTVENPYEFTAMDGEHYPAGSIDLTADSALMYVRERYSLPGGDFDRNMHQQLVMQAIIHKITSVQGIFHLGEIVDTVRKTVLTNVKAGTLIRLVSAQLGKNTNWNIVKYHVEGTTGMEECASALGQQLSVVYPYENQLSFVSDVIDSLISGDTLSQEELPAGD